ncbi:phage tail protein [Citrobacter freundii]|uniref:phage tail protein n=1 Tax=Citrobacter freundii TaxID=546 RepID=UPI001FFE0FED|nr:phage tail protein [Citrobacter freundii]
MADYYSIITNRGKELEAEALASGRLIVLTHFVVGDSNGKQVKPDSSQIRLINETYRGDIAELVVSPEQSTQLMAKIVLPTGVGGFTVREVGLMTDAGELYAVANCPSIDKPIGGVSVNMQFRLAVSDTSNITLNVATGDGLFLRIDQNLKEIKARGSEAQKTSRESIGVLDATTQQRGLVQLNSAVNSTSETQAATPAAVKIAMDNANARLAKDRNGADIPNVALFLQNLGLVETINRAAGSLQKEQNGADVPQPDWFVRNVGAARAFSGSVSIGGGGDWTTAEFIVWLESQGAFNHPSWMCKGSWSYGDNRVITDTGCGNIQLAGAVVEVMGERGAMTIRITTPTTATSGIPSAQFTYINHGDGYLPGWRRDFNTQNKPTSGDVGALPVSGGEIQGDLSVTGIASISALKANRVLSHNAATPIEFGLADQVSGNHYWDIHTTYPEIDYDYRVVFNNAGNRIDLLHKTGYAGLNVGGFGARSIQIENIDRRTGNGLIANYDPSGVLAANYGYYQGFFSVNFYSENTGAWISNPVAIKPDGTCLFGAVFDNGQRVYSPHNPQPIDFTGYATQSWVLQNFVQNIDLTAPAEVGFWDGRGYMRPTDGAAMYNFNMVGGSSNVGNFIIRYMRKQVNNTWYVIN